MFALAVSEALPFYFRLNPMLSLMSSPLITRRQDHARFPGEELVVVTAPLMPHRVARGYADPCGQVVERVDGVKVKSLTHLVELLSDGKGEFLTLKFPEDGAETLVFRRKELHEATEAVMSENGIPRRGTEELLRIWDARPASVAR